MNSCSRITALGRGLFAAALAVPLIALPDSFLHPFVLPRVLYLRAVAGLLVAVLVALALFRCRPRPAASRVVGTLVLAQLASLGLSTWFGVDRARSLHDTEERMLGLLTWACVAALFFSARRLLDDAAAVRRALRCAAAVTALVAAVALAQKIDPELLANSGSFRVGSTLGQPTDLGAVAGAGCWLALLLAALEPGRRARALALAAGAAGFVAVLASETRAALLGLGAGALLVLGAFAVGLERGSRGRRAALAALALALLAAAAALPLLGLENRVQRLRQQRAAERALLFQEYAEETGRVPQSGAEPEHWRRAFDQVAAATAAERAEIVLELDALRRRRGFALAPLADADLLGLDPALFTLENRARAARASATLEADLARAERHWSIAYQIPGVRRFARHTVTQKTAATRMQKWRVALAAGRERPWLGFGPCNYALAFHRHYLPECLEHGSQETWVDNAHSTPLNAFATQGAPGFALALALDLLPLALLYRARRRRMIALAPAALLAALFLFRAGFGVFAFDSASSLVFAALGWALVERCAGAPSPAPPASKAPPPRASARAGAIAAALLALAWCGLQANFARHNVAARRAVDAVYAGQDEAAGSLFERAEAIWSPYRASTRDLIAVALARRFAYVAERVAAGGRIQPAAVPALLALADAVDGALAATEAAHPLDVQPALRRARIALGRSAILGDGSRLTEAAAALERARAVAPLRQDLAFALADVGAQLGAPPSARIALLEPMVGAAPRVGESWVRLAQAYLEDGQADAARVLLRDAARHGARFTPTDLPLRDAVLRAAAPR